jgi:hypothetical protein
MALRMTRSASDSSWSISSQVLIADSATSAWLRRGSSVTACCTRSQQRTEISARRSTSS